ncbi:acetyl-CoA carboxylase biotin carboxyl carrier protein subunit [Sunxiuqinia elliptica]|uniref:Biotin carboxyl carrier protein n=1 Tax=Sunxiuqinia elliptica TaxID=655355 RepID=A0A4R6GY87_9BACT|nr:acetyl-CoA carboxylase biotin carboxyl carrier protein subunit [Sunxiuqinia elliptica]TDN99970.1 biotin carboxyl carrier protein [Sunxiuqinia elliptica]TDO57162.1 biotin carboxyl carrier protein [Sunxiuqinia elliptica]
MPVEIKLGDRIASVKILNQNENLIEIMVDDKVYNIDLMHNDEGTFSIIENNRSHNISLVPSQKPKTYTAYTLYNTYDLEVIDAEARYIRNRGAGGISVSDKQIVAPMPGKIVKVLVQEGDTVSQGQTAVIISAMKMESEYKAAVDGVVKRVNVSDGDTVESNQVLVEIE